MISGLHAISNKYNIDSDSCGLKESALVAKETSAIIATGKDSRHMRPQNHVVELLEPPIAGKPPKIHWVGKGLEVVRTRVSGGNQEGLFCSPCLQNVDSSSVRIHIMYNGCGG